MKARLYGYGLKSATDDERWVGLGTSGLRVSTSRLATCVVHRLSARRLSGFAWHDSFANFLDFANETIGENRFAQPGTERI